MAGCRRLIVPGLLLALLCGLAGGAMAQSPVDIYYMETHGTLGTSYTIQGTISAILSQPSAGGINGIGGTGSSVVYTNAFYVTNGTTGVDVYGALPTTYTTSSGSTAAGAYSPTVGDNITVTASYDPYHQIPEMDNITSVTLNSQSNTYPAPLVTNIQYLNDDTAGIAGPGPTHNLTSGTSTAGDVLPYDLAGMLVTLNGVYIDGAATSKNQPTFGTINSPNGGQVTIPRAQTISTRCSTTGRPLIPWRTSISRIRRSLLARWI